MTMLLEDLCLTIKEGYAAGKTMYDSDMASYIEELSSRTDEILALIDSATLADKTAPPTSP